MLQTIYVVVVPMLDIQILHRRVSLTRKFRCVRQMLQHMATSTGLALPGNTECCGIHRGNENSFLG